MDTNSDWMTQTEFAVRFGQHVRGKPFNRKTLIDWVNERRGPPHVKIGRDVCYSWSKAMQWLEQQLQNAA